MWQDALRTQHTGRFLSFEDPLSRSADRQNTNILSVFDRHLPPEMANDVAANAMWQRRQEMELYLLHPSFPNSARNYVLGRLQLFGVNGFKRNYAPERADVATKITDSHIVENLMLKTLDSHLGSQFASRYMVGAGTEARTGQVVGLLEVVYGFCWNGAMFARGHYQE